MKYSNVKFRESITKSTLCDSNKSYALLCELNVDVMDLYTSGKNAVVVREAIGDVDPDVSNQLSMWIASTVEGLQAIIDCKFPISNDRNLKALQARAHLFINKLVK